MLSGLDSAQPPTVAQADAARAAGYRVWSGYIATRPAVGLARAWSQAEFAVARRLGSAPIAFCSGWDDPVALRQLAAAWGVRLCLDIEAGIRDYGSWAQPWLNASGAGVYGNCNVHTLGAAFHVLAWYPGGSPRATWYDGACPRPGGPCGWQWRGTHGEFGVDVDSEWLDDWFGGSEMLDSNDPVVQDIIGKLGALQYDINAPGGPTGEGEVTVRLRDIHTRVAAGPPPVDVAALAAALAPRLAPVDVAALAAALAQHPLTAQLATGEHQQLANDVVALIRAQWAK